MSGWVKLHRIFKTWEWYGAPNHLAVFIDLLLHANYEDGKYRGVLIPKGSLTTSSGKIADRTGLSRQQVRTVLANLQSTSEITIKTTNKYSMISVTNWDKYQEDQPSTIAKPNKQLTTSKKLRSKEEKNVASPLSVYFTESEIIKWLGSGNESLHQSLINEYDLGYLVEQVKKAYFWQSENKPRKAGAYIATWLERDRNAIMVGGLTRNQKKLNDMLQENSKLLEGEP